MIETGDVLQQVSHRPWNLPGGPWRYYQEWNNALFLHWKAPPDDLAGLVPGSLSIDTFEGEAWVSLVAFTMENIRPRGLPAVPAISDFHEVNIRTYLTADNKPGVYFLSIEAGKYFSAWVSKFLSGLPYEKAAINRIQNNGTQEYTSANPNKGFRLEASFAVKEKILAPTELDRWLTERYCLYLDKNNRIYRYETHHKPWDLHHVEMIRLETAYKIGNLLLNRKPDLTHYSRGVKVVAWEAQPVTIRTNGG